MCMCVCVCMSLASDLFFYVLLAADDGSCCLRSLFERQHCEALAFVNYRSHVTYPTYPAWSYLVQFEAHHRLLVVYLLLDVLTELRGSESPKQESSTMIAEMVSCAESAGRRESDALSAMDHEASIAELESWGIFVLPLSRIGHP
mmetsp:Transcript_33106/g.71028  ORF Transcript_33106/g.71028 Transcript_33106/m.71028 type:complete len:145 (-) Transcript_33106:105-539(-)